MVVMCIFNAGNLVTLQRSKTVPDSLVPANNVSTMGEDVNARTLCNEPSMLALLQLHYKLVSK